MAKPMVSDELQVLRYFKDGPIEKVEVVFNIVTDQMRERLRGRGGETCAPAKDAGATSRRRPSPANNTPAEQVPPQGPVV
jgi:hypothetical protein